MDVALGGITQVLHKYCNDIFFVLTGTSSSSLLLGKGLTCAATMKTLLNFSWNRAETSCRFAPFTMKEAPLLTKPLSP